MWFKSLSALLLLTSCNTLGLALQESSTLSGFHITIKSNNANEIQVNNKWDKVNETYQNFIKNNIDQNLIKVPFDNWKDIINFQNNDTSINQKIYDSFMTQINNNQNLELLKNNQANFGTQAIAKSVATINFDLQIKSFGNIYLPYYDSRKKMINNSIFATICPHYDFKNYFSVPYGIEPSANLLSKPLNDRIGIFPLSNNYRNSTNERWLVILAKNPNEQLLINEKNSDIFSTDKIDYALLDHGINGFKDITYAISVKNKETSNTTSIKDLTLTNTTSMIQFTTNDNKNPEILNHDFLIFNKNQDPKNLIVINKAKESARVKLPDNKKANKNQEWYQYNVDAKTLAIDFNIRTLVNENTPLTINNLNDSYQVYYLQQEDSNFQKANNSGQYVVVYRTTCPNFTNWTNLNPNTNNLIVKGFQQYLTSISTDMPIEKLEKDASQFINYFIDYKQDLANYNFVNYFGNDKNAPWKMNSKLHEVMIVNNWKVIIISIIMMLSLILIIPIAIFFFKKEKRLK